MSRTVITPEGGGYTRLWYRVRYVAFSQGALGPLLVLRMWQSLSGIGSLLLIAKYLSIQEQGYYYTFANILNLRMLFDLGLSNVVLQFASHEMASLVWSEGLLIGPLDARSRLGSLIRMVIRWYGIASSAFVLILIPCGILFLERDRSIEVSQWLWPWVLSVIATAVLISTIPLAAVLEGCDLMASVARLRLGLGIAGTMLFWVTLVRGGGLWGAPLINMMNAGGLAVWCLTSKRKPLTALAGLSDTAATLSFRKDMFSMQWRIAVSYASGYFVSYVLTPVIFRYQGPFAAAQVGMSLAISQALTTIAGTWIWAKAPTFGRYIAEKRFVELDKEFFHALATSLVWLIAGSIALSLACVAARHWKTPIANRLLSPGPMSALLAAGVVNHLLFSQAVYLRAHRREALVPLSLVLGAVTTVVAMVSAKFQGVEGMCFNYLCSTIVIAGGWGTYIFVRKKKQWHALGL